MYTFHTKNTRVQRCLLSELLSEKVHHKYEMLINYHIFQMGDFSINNLHQNIIVIGY